MTLSRLVQAIVLLRQCVATAYTPSSTPSSPMSKSPRWSSPSALFSATVPVDGGTSITSTSSSDGSATISTDQIKTRDLLSLDYIRSTLIRQEETIIFALIERAQFRQNKKVYVKGGVPGLMEDTSFLDFMLSGTVSEYAFIHLFFLLWTACL